ncbi:von Willebrand factor type A domain protein [Adhaeretor mobilis]|uniref:von Willebrand factor type A domain protein n=2 Tax=Adhaeretor mobilis TaxID=1930276 RepID=A0A517MPU4_9BACT|nr:von Willebrand factor type A domain protein [Adhaeretor mobilis]
MHFGNLSNLNYLWLIAVVVVVVGSAIVAQRRAMGRFATENRLSAFVSKRSVRRRWIQTVLSLGALVALVGALVDVRWGKSWHEVPQKGIEVVFALDVSRSMLAEDVVPNRLGRAKQQIKDMVDELSGDRVGLVVFAGDAKRKIPLTTHYDDFKRSLDAVGPQDIRHGGSSLGDAIQVAADSFLAKTADHKAIVLFTDGEDHESEPVEVAESAFENEGVRIFTVGLGDASQGARVPTANSGRGQGYLEYGGEQVWSKLDGSVLKSIALATDGAYVPAGTKQVDMAQVYRDYVAQVEQQDFETARINAYMPRYQWFVAVALLLTVLKVLVTDSKRETTATSNTLPLSNGSRAVLKSAAAIGFLSLSLGAASPSFANETNAYALAAEANQSIDAGNFEQAADRYSHAVTSAPDRAELKYNQAVALYRAGDLNGARQLFAAAAGSDRGLEAKARFNLANCDYSEALQVATQDRQLATEKARSAISHYRDALVANPSDADARANIELAGLLLRQLQEQEKQEKEQQQEQKQQNSEQESEQSQDSQGEESDQQQGESGSKDSQNPPEEPEGGESSSGESSEPQSQDTSSPKPSEGEPSETETDESSADETKTGDTGEQEKESESSDSEDSNASGQEDASQQQQASGGAHNEQSNEDNQAREQSETQNSQDPQSSQDSQSPTASQPPQAENSSGSPGKEDPMDEQHDGSVPQSIQGKLDEAPQATDRAEAAALIDSGKPMTRQEAMKMLQSVRDRDLMRRLQKQQRAARQYVPGAKDW